MLFKYKKNYLLLLKGIFCAFVRKIIRHVLEKIKSTNRKQYKATKLNHPIKNNLYFC